MMRLPKAFWKNFELIVLSRLPYYVFLGLLTLKGKVCSYEAKEKAQRGILGLCAAHSSPSPTVLSLGTPKRASSSLRCLM